MFQPPSFHGEVSCTIQALNHIGEDEGKFKAPLFEKKTQTEESPGIPDFTTKTKQKKSLKRHRRSSRNSPRHSAIKTRTPQANIERSHTTPVKKVHKKIDRKKRSNSTKPDTKSKSSHNFPVVGPDASLISYLVKNVLKKRNRRCWEDVLGLEHAKKELHESFVLSEAYGRRSKSFETSVLLYGPKGVGKTVLALAFANECQSVLLHFDCDKILPKFSSDELRRMIIQLFLMARFYAPATIFIDNMDAFDSKYPVEVLNEFTYQMDNTFSMESPVYIMGASKKPWGISPLLDFEKKLYIRLPDQKTRASILEKKLPSVEKSKRKTLARVMEGYSVKDMLKFCKIVRKMETEKFLQLVKKSDKEMSKDIRSTLKLGKPLSRKVLKKFDDVFKDTAE